MTKKELEKYSSAVTLSDMEMFIFPELLLALALANMMSPVLWEWKKDVWFKDLEKLAPYRRVLRVKQYIIQHYDFNLDLDTWGLTTKTAEIDRFKDFIDAEALAQSNALFGYEGDRYYFDTNIRKHFGLDQYQDEIIPYWKTETIEAMTAFKYKSGYKKGAGECVSFSVLYYAALFIVAKIPLSQLYMMATPLHSQNFIALGEGILTNNRRIVTKNMWSNGTLLSVKARRALENERVTLVVNHEGYYHTLYEEANMPPSSYHAFASQLEHYLNATMNYELWINFLRQYKTWQKFFYFTYIQQKEIKIGTECLYSYENTVTEVINEKNENNFIQTIISHGTNSPMEVTWIEPVGRLSMAVVKQNIKQKGLIGLKNYLTQIEEGKKIIEDFEAFASIKPKLPLGEKITKESYGLSLEKINNREELLTYIDQEKENSEIVRLALMAYRDLTKVPSEPFIKAALERNPVSVEATKELPDKEVYMMLREFENESIYSEKRLAQPDEVWNYRRGDGIEKALCLWNVLRARNNKAHWRLYVIGKEVTLTNDCVVYLFDTCKELIVNWEYPQASL